MAFEEQGTRIDDLKMVIGKVSYATSLFDQDGIQVRFMNSKLEGNVSLFLCSIGNSFDFTDHFHD